MYRLVDRPAIEERAPTTILLPPSPCSLVLSCQSSTRLSLSIPSSNPTRPGLSRMCRIDPVAIFSRHRRLHRHRKIATSLIHPKDDPGPRPEYGYRVSVFSDIGRSVHHRPNCSSNSVSFSALLEPAGQCDEVEVNRFPERGLEEQKQPVQTHFEYPLSAPSK